MKRQLMTVLVVAILAIAGSNASALETWTFSGAACYDTMIASAYPMTGGYLFGGSYRNYGGLDWFGVKEGHTRSLLRFDVSALAGQYIDIVSITLRLYQRNATVSDLTVFQMTPGNSDWQEGLDTGSYSKWYGSRTNWSYCLWHAYDHPWEGGAGVGDRGPVLASTAATSGGGWTELSFTGDLNALMDAWVQSPATDGLGSFIVGGGIGVALNEGMLIQGNGAEFYSKNNANGLGPQLVVVALTGPAPGDFDDNTHVDTLDIDLLCDAIRTGSTNFALFDISADGLTGGQDGVIDLKDLDYLIRFLVETTIGNGTEYGDFNLDGVIDTTDLTRLATYYGTGDTWAKGNANRYIDLVTDTTDLTILATYYGFGEPDAVPEPASAGLLLLGASAVLTRRRKSKR